MKSAVLASLIAGAAAFAPAQTKTSSTALAASPFANEVGAVAPLGYFDPMGLCKDGNQDTFDRLRYSEIKNGRVAMLAVVGYLVTRAGVRIPGYEDVPSGFAAFEQMPESAAYFFGFTVAILEIMMHDEPGTGNEHIGDFRNGFIDFGWDKFDAETKLKKRTIELQNGRAAMMGIWGIMVHEKMGNLDLIMA